MKWTVVLHAMQSAQTLFIVAALAIAGTCGRMRHGQKPDVHKRGVVVSERRCARPRPAEPAGSIALAGCQVASGDETKHFKIIGTTGNRQVHRNPGNCSAPRSPGATGRSSPIPTEVIATASSNRCRGDVILNPFELDSVKWDPFSEIEDPYDADQLAAGLVPSTADAASNEWRGYARTFLASVLRRCRVAARRSVAELWRLLAIASPEELRSVVVDTPAQPFLDPENARMFGSIRSVAVSAIAALEYIQQQRSAPFSVRGWVRGAGAPGALFITYKAAQVAALRSHDCDLDATCIFEAMNGSENHDQRLWFVVDELDALGNRRPQGRPRAPAKIRRPLRTGFSINRAGFGHLRRLRSANHHRKLRQYSDISLLGQRKRRHVAIRLQADRRARNHSQTDVAWQRPGGPSVLPAHASRRTSASSTLQSSPSWLRRSSSSRSLRVLQIGLLPGMAQGLVRRQGSPCITMSIYGRRNFFWPAPRGLAGIAVR